jgi:UDP-N-acetylglucosamine 2-epimerase
MSRMPRVLSVVGVRPQFVKHAPVSEAMAGRFEEVLVHTGQHYDYAMSRLFFEELGIRAPDRHLEVGSGTHAEQTGRVAERTEAVILELAPDLVLVFGDTNSTLGAALAAAKLRVPLAHVEAGVRAGLKEMAEEQNRVLVDHASDVLFAPTADAVAHLTREAAHGAVHLTGDVMRDALEQHVARARARPDPAARHGLAPGSYLLLTLHRAENTDDPRALGGILDGLALVDEPVLFPVHPRTRAALDRTGLAARLSALPHLHPIDPVGYLDMLGLQAGARLVVTDSGGIQKEAYLLGTPCLTLFPCTSWVETVAAGWNRLVPEYGAALAAAIRDMVPPEHRPELYGDGRAAGRIADLLADYLGRVRAGGGSVRGASSAPHR